MGKSKPGSKSTPQKYNSPTETRTAILVDGSYFQKRYNKIFPHTMDPKVVISNFYTYMHKHVENKYLYRIFYYDCLPFNKKVHLPISKKSFDFSKSDQFDFRNEFLYELKKKRKVALRMGNLRDGGSWIIKKSSQKLLIQEKVKYHDLNDNDFKYDLGQKGIDIKIGCDIASLAYKKLVDQIILVSGDSDFVPAAKVARREGIDFILDPMYNNIRDNLFEHIDGLKSAMPLIKK